MVGVDVCCAAFLVVFLLLFLFLPASFEAQPESCCARTHSAALVAACGCFLELALLVFLARALLGLTVLPGDTVGGTGVVGRSRSLSR